jgi:hypothetical protein
VAAACLAGPALAQAGSIEASPAAVLAEVLVVPAGQRVSYDVRLSGVGAGATGQLTATRGGREVWNLPLTLRGGVWHATGTLAQPGRHVITVRLLDGARAVTAAVDVNADEAPRRGGPARLELEFAATSGRAGGDASGWWGVVAMLVLVVGVAAGTAGLRVRRRGA